MGNQLEVTISLFSTLIYGVYARVSLVGAFVRVDVFSVCAIVNSWWGQTIVNCWSRS